MVVEALKMLGNGECRVQVGRKRKHECHFGGKDIEHTLMPNSGVEPSKEPGTTTGSSRKATGRHEKENATNKQRIEILNWYHKNGKNQTHTAKHFDRIYPSLHLKQPLISSWVKNEAKWQAEYELLENGVAHSAKCACQTHHPEVMEMMDLWVLKAIEDSLLLTGEVLCQKW